jgi:hypothetical protein
MIGLKIDFGKYLFYPQTGFQQSIYVNFMASSKFVRFFLIACRSVIIGCGLIPWAANGGECSVLEFLPEKSQMSDMLVNPCLSEHSAGVGAIFQLHPGGRLWLKTQAVSESSALYQLICRNKSTKASKVSVTGFALPWIQAAGFATCNQWVGNKMECKNPDNSQDVLYCAIATTTKPERIQGIQRNTSLTMRSVMSDAKSQEASQPVSNAVGQLAALIKPEIDLCRHAYQNRESLNIQWVIKATGGVSQPSLNDPVVDHEFAACVFDVVKNFQFPSLAEDLPFSYRF